MNIFFSLFELMILFLLLKPPLFIQTDISYLPFFLTSIILAVLLYFFLNFLIGLVGFWSPEVWGPRFILGIVLSFFAGGLFPLDIFPKPIFDFFQILPFSYLLFFPLKIYLGQLSLSQIFAGLFISAAWVIFLYLIVKITWGKGLRIYSAEGG